MQTRQLPVSNGSNSKIMMMMMIIIIIIIIIKTSIGPIAVDIRALFHHTINEK